ncbi:hypothetical protein HNR23_000672 [Nocardiopsis mwathae]|uniref:DUF3592 domain-containing protein n=1 Tax=Nocardiopsis mwathae TaxID=1472723 RepID=A0A7X0D3V3_9ACTN|nr:hypothetical protein [Nocardiopsis mwathae]
MFDLDSGAVLLVGAIAVYVAYNVVKSLFAWLRRQWLDRRGVHAEAVIVGVAPLDPPQHLEHPFGLRFRTPSGAEHTTELKKGFGGIVPVVGWRLPVRFDPRWPSNVEITHNPYLRPIPGAPQPRRRTASQKAVQHGLDVAITAAMLALVLVNESFPDARSVVIGGIVVLAGVRVLTTAVWSAGESAALRRSPGHTVATVTHSWKESARARRSSSPGDITVSSRGRVNAFTVLFDLPDGRQVHRRAPMTTALTRYEPGDEVDVAYDPSDPTSITIASGWSSTVAPALGTGSGILLIVLGLAIATNLLP